MMWVWLLPLCGALAQQVCNGTFKISEPELVNCTTLIGHIIEEGDDVTGEVVLPLLKNVTGRIKITNTALQSISIPLLQTVSDIEFYGNDQLTLFDTPCLTHVEGRYWLENNNFQRHALPSLKSVGQFFEILQVQKAIVSIDVRNLVDVGDYCIIGAVEKDLCTVLRKCVASDNQFPTTCPLPPGVCKAAPLPDEGITPEELNSFAKLTSGIVALMLVVLLMVGIGFCCFRRWKKNRRVNVGLPGESTTQ